MTDDIGLEPLFRPFSIRGLTLANRFVMPAMQRQWCIDGCPLPRLTEYYCERAKGGVGLLLTESCAVDHPSSTQNPVYARMNEETVDAWAACVRAVKSHGTPMLMQLWHEGAIRKEGGSGRYADHPTLSPSGLMHGAKANGRAAAGAELEAIREGFVRSALLARQAGFDGVELHSAHQGSCMGPRQMVALQQAPSSKPLERGLSEALCSRGRRGSTVWSSTPPMGSCSINFCGPRPIGEPIHMVARRYSTAYASLPKS